MHLLLSLSAMAALPTSDYADLAEAVFRVRHTGRSAVPFDVDSKVFRWAGGARVRVIPRIDGLPIAGSSQVVALDEWGGEIRITGPALLLDRPQWGDLSAVEAVDVARAAAANLGRGLLWAPRVTEGLRLVEGVPRHTLVVDIGIAEPLATWRIWVDAVDGSVLAYDQTGHTARGRIYDPSPVAGPPVEVELKYQHDPSVLSGRYADAWSCTDWTIPDSLFAASSCDAMARRAQPMGQDFFFEPAPGAPDDPFTEVNLYHHVSLVAAHFETRFGLRRARPFTTIANFEMANAFFGDFDGDGAADLSFGFTEDVQFGYDAEVVYHEFGHWVVGRLADIPSLSADEIGLDWVGGSINEGAADIFSMLLEPDPNLGEYAGGGFGDGPIRALDEDRSCPGDLVGEVHVDGEILGSMGWNLIQALGTDLTGELMVGAVSSWGSDINWTRVAVSFIDAADDLRAAGMLSAAQHQVVLDEVERSQMRGCPRVIPLDQGNVQGAFVLSGGLQGELYRIPGQNQYSIDVPANAERLVVGISDFRGPPGLVWSVLVRRGEPILNRPSILGNLGLGFATPVDFDWVADGADAFEQLVIDADSEPPLVPGQTYYIQVAGRTDGTIELFDFTRGRLQVRAEVGLPAEARGGCDTAPGPTPMELSWLQWGTRR